MEKVKEIITQIEALRKKADELKKECPFFGNAMSALNSAKDNFTWHIESEEEKAKKAKASENASAPKPNGAASKAN